MKPVKLARIALGKRLKSAHCLRDPCLLLSLIERESPGLTRVSVRFRVAFRRDVSKRKSVARDLGHGTERDRNRPKRTVCHLKRHSHAVLYLDRIYARAHSAKHTFHRPQNVEHHVQGVDRVAEQGAPQLGSPPPAPWIVVVLPRSPPSHVHVKDKGFASELLVHQVFELLQTVAKSVLK